MTSLERYNMLKGVLALVTAALYLYALSLPAYTSIAKVQNGLECLVSLILLLPAMFIDPLSSLFIVFWMANPLFLMWWILNLADDARGALILSVAGFALSTSCVLFLGFMTQGVLHLGAFVWLGSFALAFIGSLGSYFLRSPRW